jgi:hypothetical protein
MPILPLAVGEHDEQDHFRVHLLAMHDVRSDLEPRAPGRDASQVQSMVSVPACRVFIEAVKKESFESLNV